MAQQAPAMSPSDLPIGPVLDRATGPRRAEVDELLALHQSLSDDPPVVWAGRIIGFGLIEYRYESGHRGIMPEIAFAPGSARHTLYLVDDFSTRWPDLVERLGPHRASKACLYLTRLTQVDREALTELIRRSRDLSLERYVHG